MRRALAELEPQLAALAVAEADHLERVHRQAQEPSSRVDAARMVRNLGGVWKRAQAQERRRILALLAEEGYVSPDGQIRWIWREPLDLAKD
jgi:hypothetical protein